MIKRMKHITIFMASLCMIFLATGCDTKAKQQNVNELSDAQVEDIVRRSYQYVAMYNVNNKFAMTQDGWNTIKPDTELKDHTMTDIARSNNDTVHRGNPRSKR